MRWILRTVYKECRKGEAQVLSCLTWIRANSDTGSIMQCCGIIDVEGTQLSSEERFWQALHGLYIPHSQVEHEILPKEFPSYTYNGGSSMDCLLVDICGI